MQPTQQRAYKACLLDLRKRLIEEVGSAEEALREDISATGDQSALPTHPGDRDAEGLLEQLSIAQNEERILEQVEGALERIESGEFGTCQDCGRKIAKPRLDAIPFTPWCIDCARQHENQATEA